MRSFEFKTVCIRGGQYVLYAHFELRFEFASDSDFAAPTTLVILD